jgi:uncharacterized peroxidase-related enzyme
VTRSAKEADALVHAVARDWRSAPLSATDRALCEFAVKMTRREEPMTPADLDTLRGEGLDDRAIHDAAQVIAYFNYITRIADSLGVEMESFLGHWGRGSASAPR